MGAKNTRTLAALERYRNELLALLTYSFDLGEKTNGGLLLSTARAKGLAVVIAARLKAAGLDVPASVAKWLPVEKVAKTDGRKGARVA